MRAGGHCQRAPPPLISRATGRLKPSPPPSVGAGLPAPTAVHIAFGCMVLSMTRFDGVAETCLHLLSICSFTFSSCGTCSLGRFIFSFVTFKLSRRLLSTFFSAMPSATRFHSKSTSSAATLSFSPPCLPLVCSQLRTGRTAARDPQPGDLCHHGTRWAGISIVSFSLAVSTFSCT